MVLVRFGQGLVYVQSKLPEAEIRSYLVRARLARASDRSPKTLVLGGWLMADGNRDVEDFRDPTSRIVDS